MSHALVIYFCLTCVNSLNLEFCFILFHFWRKKCCWFLVWMQWIHLLSCCCQRLESSTFRSHACGHCFSFLFSPVNTYWLIELVYLPLISPATFHTYLLLNHYCSLWCFQIKASFLFLNCHLAVASPLASNRFSTCGSLSSITWFFSYLFFFFSSFEFCGAASWEQPYGWCLVPLSSCQWDPQ